MPNIKELLIKQINEYDRKAAECCQRIIYAKITNKSVPDLRQALIKPHQGRHLGILEKLVVY